MRPYFNIPFEGRTRQVWAYSWHTLYFLDPRIASIFFLSDRLSYVTVFQCALWRSHKAVLTVIKPVVSHYLVLCDRISMFPWKVTKGRFDLIQLSPLLECDPTVCLPEKSKVTRGWPNFSRGDNPSGHTPTRVIIGILYQIFLHHTPNNRIPAALRKYSI